MSNYDKQMSYYLEGLDEMPDITDRDDETNAIGSSTGSAIHRVLEQFFLSGEAQAGLRMRALEALIPIFDAGIDIMAVEGAVKSPSMFGTVERQRAIRQSMIDGVRSGLSVLGVSPLEVDSALDKLSADGVQLRQHIPDIADRLQTWDRVYLITMLYGPSQAGEILTREIVD